MLQKIKQAKLKVPSFPKFKIPSVKFHLNKKNGRVIYLAPLVILLVITTLIYKNNLRLESDSQAITKEKNDLRNDLADLQKKYDDLKNEDQIVRNNNLADEINNIHDTYKQAVTVYESLLSFKDKTKDTAKLDDAFSNILTLLSQRNYTEAEDKLNTLSSDIKKKNDEIDASFKIPASVTESNSPPSSGYQSQKVTTDTGSFMVSIISADTGSTKVIVDTASDSDCGNECPVLSLADYVSRNGAYAGINGTYFCPASYPSCAGKTNSYDLLVMNHKKTYFNSGNNVYSTNPAVIFGDGYVRFVSHASEWGRDTSPNGVLSNYPLLVQNSNIVFTGDGDPKHNNRGGRSFVGNIGNTVYIGVVFSSTVMDSAKVMKTLGFENAMNLDDGGSTALWSGGYKAGPGRNIPNAILFVKK